jgi:hypothetical protein
MLVELRAKFMRIIYRNIVRAVLFHVSSAPVVHVRQGRVARVPVVLRAHIFAFVWFGMPRQFSHPHHVVMRVAHFHGDVRVRVELHYPKLALVLWLSIYYFFLSLSLFLALALSRTLLLYRHY